MLLCFGPGSWDFGGFQAIFKCGHHEGGRIIVVMDCRFLGNFIFLQTRLKGWNLEICFTL